MTLREYVCGPIREARPDLARHYQRILIAVVNRFCDWLQREVLTSEVTPEMIDSYAASFRTRWARESNAVRLRAVMRTIDPIRFRKSRVHRVEEAE